MMKSHSVATLIEELRRLLEPDTDVLFAYLYGSSVNDPDLFQSDIDVGVYLKPGDLKEYVKKEEQLTAFLVSHLHNDRIDLRIINALPLLLNYSILRDGILIFSRDELERVDFDTTSMIKFFELKPYLDEYNRILSQRIGGSE
jgi:predicted nucleotidyltransferase